MSPLLLIIHTSTQVSVLIVELITTELWKERVYPIIIEHSCELGSTLPVYMVLFHEATVTGLLETTLYHQEACEQAGDAIIDLGWSVVFRLLNYTHLDGVHNENSYLSNCQSDLSSTTVYLI